MKGFFAMENVEKRNIKEIALYYLASLYYDREFLTWDKFEDMAVVFHQNSRLESCWNRRTRKSFEQMSLYLLEMFQMIKRDSDKAYWLYYENSQCVSLGKMDGIGRLSHYDKIAELSLKMRNCIKNKTFINDYILSLKEKIVSQVMYLKCNQEFDESIKAEIFEQFAILNEMNDNHPEDIFRQAKKVKRLLDQNTRMINLKAQKEELENRKRQEEIRTKNQPKVDEINTYFNSPKEQLEDIMEIAVPILEKMRALKETTTDENEKKVLEAKIFNMEMSLLIGNVEAIQKEIAQFEDMSNANRRSR